MRLPSATSTDSTSQQAACGIGVRACDVSKIFSGGVKAVDHLSLDIPAGEFIALLGPSGCGKSTLLRMVAGLETPTSGSLETDSSTDGSGSRSAHRVAYVFQDPHLMPWRRLLSNVTLPLELRGEQRLRAREKAMDALEQVGLTGFAKRYPAQLSGGMRMRVSIARALVTDPALLLLDEPFAALDELTRQRLDEQLYELWRKRGMTVIFVTHSIAEAAYLAQRVVVLSARPARIEADRPVQLPIERPPSLRGSPEFAAQTAWMLEALQKGEQ